jgi:hypothetical protein
MASFIMKIKNEMLKGIVKYIILTMFVNCICSHYSYGQYKIIRLESENLFIRYYYKTDSSDEIKNDTTYFLCLRRKKDTVCIEKFVDSIKIWSNLYTTKRAKKSLPIRQKKRKKIETVYEPFYIARLVSKSRVSAKYSPK